MTSPEDRAYRTALVIRAVRLGIQHPGVARSLMRDAEQKASAVDRDESYRAAHHLIAEELREALDA